MHRRNILWGAVSALGAAFAATRASAATESPPAAKLKVVYHLNDLDKVSFVIGNIQNHLDGVGGPEHVTIALVMHGQALQVVSCGFRQPGYQAGASARFAKAGVELAACGNTMKSQKVELKDLLPGFISADTGRRGPDRGTAVAGLSVFATLIRPHLANVTKSHRDISARWLDPSGIDMLVNGVIAPGYAYSPSSA